MSRGGAKRGSKHVAAVSRGMPLAATALVVLLGIAPVVWDPGGLQAFLHPKLLFVGLGLFLAVWTTRRTSMEFPASRTTRMALLTFVIVALVSALLATAPMIAIFGAATRQFGLVMWFAQIGAFIVGVNLFRDDPTDGLRWAATGISVGLVIASALGLAEAAGVSPFTFTQSFDGRVQSVFGNPAVFAAYIVLGLPLAVGLALDGVAGSGRRWLGGVAGGMAIPALVLTGARGAWLGAAVGLGIAAVLLVQRNRRPRWMMFVGVAAIVIAFAATIPSGRWSSLGEAGEGRLAIWEVATASMAANPVLGVGPEGFADSFGEYVSVDFVERYSRDQVYDRAHNGILDVGVTTGVPGMLAYLVLIGGTLVVVYRGARSGATLSAAAAIGVAAYLVQQQTLFQLPVLDTVFWVIVGLLTRGLVTLTQLRQRARWPAFVLATFGVLIAGYAMLGIRADRLDREALMASSPQTAIDVLSSAASIRPFDNVHYILAASIAREVPNTSLVRESIELVASGRRYAPRDQMLVIAQVNLLFQQYRLTGNEVYLDEGDLLLVDLLSRDPANGEAYLRLGTSAYYRQESQVAREQWRRAERLLPNSAAPRANLDVLEAEQEG